MNHPRDHIAALFRTIEEFVKFPASQQQRNAFQKHEKVVASIKFKPMHLHVEIGVIKHIRMISPTDQLILSSQVL